MIRRVALFLGPALVATALFVAPAPAAVAAVPAPGLDGIPSGAPPAAYAAEPVLPAPGAWPFPEAFPRTSGTGRLAGGASFWSDFLYDDHGATGLMVETPTAALAPSNGTYVYSNPAALRNGADIFRAAVGLDAAATYWRVDWNTLADAAVPIAEWTFDTDADTHTGATAWPASAGVSSAGIDRALVVSSRGARLIDPVTGAILAGFGVTVDLAARSFVVRIPRSILLVSGQWRVRLAAGLSDPSGSQFKKVPVTDGSLKGQARVYNVTFRSVLAEPPVFKPSGDAGELEGNGLARGFKYGNYWMEDHQADALTAGDVSAFALAVSWDELAGRVSTPEPQPTGYSNRWYVSSLNLGQGVVRDSGNNTGDLRPNFLGRVQPYAVYVPSDYRPTRRTPLTWLLHSLSVMHNQYGALDPSMIGQLCEDRGSICATTLGYGPDGWYFDEAELDFFRVWHDLALTYALDPERTVISGYSMGGFASYHLGLKYADLFAAAMPLAGPPGCGARLTEKLAEPAGSGRCGQDGDTTPLIRNARWVPYVMGDGVADELVPVTSVIEQIQTFDDLGYRYRFELYPAEDHLVYATQDGFSSEIAHLGVGPRIVNPGRIDYTWYGDDTRADFGTGPTGAYWVRDPVARNASPGTLSSLTAISAARPDPAVTPKRTHKPAVPGDPTPAIVQELTWIAGARPAASSALSLTLTNVAALGVDMVRAGFVHGAVTLTTDGATTLRLLGLPAGTRVFRGATLVATANALGTATVIVPSGSTTYSLTA